MAAELPPPLFLDEADFAERVRLSPLVAIDVVVRNCDGKVLLALRNEEPAKGHYFLPGGCILKNEPIEAAFERLLARETGCRIGYQGARFLGAYQHFYRATRFGSDASGTHYVALAYEVALKDAAAVRLDGTHSAYRWLSEAEVLASPAVHEYAKDYFRPGRRTHHAAL